MRTPFTEGCDGATYQTLPPGPQISCTFRPTSCSAVQCSSVQFSGSGAIAHSLTSVARFLPCTRHFAVAISCPSKPRKAYKIRFGACTAGANLYPGMAVCTYRLALPCASALLHNWGCCPVSYYFTSSGLNISHMQLKENHGSGFELHTWCVHAFQSFFENPN